MTIVKLPKLLGALTIALLAPVAAIACSCLARPSALDEFESNPIVVIVRATAVEKTDEQYSYGGIKSTTMVVDKVYKGAIKVGSQMVFGQGGGGDCIATFDQDDIGRQFLFYLHPPSEGSERWTAGTCGRDGPAEFHKDDILFLENLKNRLGHTRLAGRVAYY